MTEENRILSEDGVFLSFIVMHTPEHKLVKVPAADVVYSVNNFKTTVKAKDYAYYERNQLVAALSKLFPAWIERHPDSDTTWDKAWRNIIFINLPTGQCSWHIHDSEFNNFQHLPQSVAGIQSWDGHTNEIKYERLAALKSIKEPA